MKKYRRLSENKWKYLQKLSEGLRLSDLRQNSGISDFTLPFKRERNKVMKSETFVSKLVDAKITGNGHVDFTFKSKGTDVYPPNEKFKIALRKNQYKLSNNPSHEYTIILRILNVMDWLKTYPEKDVITNKDIKDILDVSDIQIDSSVPAWYWQGMAYNMQDFDATIYETPIRPPSHWNDDKYHGDGNAFLDKITQSIINQIPFYRNLMASSLTRQLKDKNLI